MGEQSVRKLWYRCQSCNFQRTGKNILDFEDMVLVKDCANCGGHFKLKCFNCGMVNKTKWLEVRE
jgi:uncharacterized Zn finger protein